MTVMLICLGGSADDNYKGIIKMLDVLLSRKVDPEETGVIKINKAAIPLADVAEITGSDESLFKKDEWGRADQSAVHLASKSSLFSFNPTDNCFLISAPPGINPIALI